MTDVASLSLCLTDSLFFLDTFLSWVVSIFFLLETEGDQVILGVVPAAAKSVKEGLVKTVKVGDLSFEVDFVRVPSSPVSSTRRAGCRSADPGLWL